MEAALPRCQDRTPQRPAQRQGLDLAAWLRDLCRCRPPAVRQVRRHDRRGGRPHAFPLPVLRTNPRQALAECRAAWGEMLAAEVIKPRSAARPEHAVRKLIGPSSKSPSRPGNLWVKAAESIAEPSPSSSILVNGLHQRMPFPAHRFDPEPTGMNQGSAVRLTTVRYFRPGGQRLCPSKFALCPPLVPPVPLGPVPRPMAGPARPGSWMLVTQVRHSASIPGAGPGAIRRDAVVHLRRRPFAVRLFFATQEPSSRRRPNSYRDPGRERGSRRGLGPTTQLGYPHRLWIVDAIGLLLLPSLMPWADRP